MRKRSDRGTEEIQRCVPEQAAQSALLTENAVHQVECDVRRQLLAESGLNFSSLVVRRVRDGVCLEGVVEVDDECPDVSRLARRVAGVNQVLNHLVMHHRRRPPAKG